MAEVTVQTIDVTPNPRILQMLGEIAFEPWQCIAELIDNSLDAYLTAVSVQDDWLAEVGLEHFGIDVQLPTKQEFELGIGKVSVSDTGPGMDLEQLSNSVTAGFSGNAPLEKLGLFGMGFNIATARLGRTTRIKTTCEGGTSWLVLELDLDEMQSTGEFKASIDYEPKDDDAHHGTVVEILRLKTEFRGQFTSGAGRGSIKKQLSRIYSAILNEQDVEIRFCEYELSPWKHCIWSPERTAIVGSGTQAPAFIPIDHPLPDYYFCNVCWHWSSPPSIKEEGTCPACGAKDSIELKPRRISGWLGIQRYFDVSHYGIDFIRNGRIIEQLNKDCFYWNEGGELEIEYPIDTKHWGGRIVGQINIDFAQVDYQKTSFSKDRNEWKEVIDYLRGESPLRPKKAEERGYHENTSPIYQLYKVFRSGNRSGRRMLIPGQYGNPLKGDNADATAWAESFYKGDPDFQTDEKWWERVTQAENARRGISEPTDEDEPDEDIDIEDPFGPDDGPTPDEPTGEEADYLVPDIDLSQRYSFPDPNETMKPVEVTVFIDTRDLRARDLKDLPPFIVDSRQAPHRFLLTYHPKHPAFSEFAESPQDYLLIELAHWFSTRQGGGDWTAGRVYKKLKDEHQRAQKLDLHSLGMSAGELLSELKQHLAECGIEKAEADAGQALLDELTSDVMSAEGDVKQVARLLASGKWIERVTDEYMLHEIEANPQLIMDGEFLRTSYESIRQESIKKETVDRIVSCLRDVIMIKKTADRSSMPDKSLLLRADAAINYLVQQRA